MIVHGRVQGVFFRDTCQQRAHQQHVGGWVINRPDGSVEAAFEGAPDRVDAMVDWVRQGPPNATVTRVDTAEEAVQGQTEFTVER